MDSKQLLNRVTQQLKQASADSVTQAGQNSAPSDDQLSAINQIFELFRFNYHNQFLKAFPDLDTMNMAKRLWLRLLGDYTGEVIMRAAEKAVKENSWLPNVHEVLARCDVAEVLGLPSAHAAYVEACRAPSPKKEFNWSHAAVYFAGLSTDWFFIANEPEEKVFPVFKRNYELLLNRLQNGESLEIELPKALPEETTTPLSREEQKARMQDLMGGF
ncbi:replication protein P [Thalassolituus maritimus]|uniref:Replicative helicase inhibitor G39P N-terminal domain-containing protein n=1 Tax=Thalassolituus maritimus TaxID=484498 RepID=A0ABQ0A3D4_9GAMM